MIQPNLLELAKQGDANAIASLMNRKLQPKGITAKASMKNNCLQIMLSAAQVPPQENWMAIIRKSMASLGAENIDRVKVFGKKTGEEFPDWIEEFELAEKLNLSSHTPEVTAEVENANFIVKAETDNQLAPQEESNPFSFWGSISKKVKNAGGAIANASVQAGKAAIEKVPEVGGAIAQTASGAGKVVVKKATGVGGAIAAKASGGGKVVVEKATEVGGAIAGTASQAGKLVVEKATGVGGAIADSGKVVVQKATNVVTPIIDATGKTIAIAKNATTDWLSRVIDKVDIVKAETEVRKLEEQHPNELPNKIAHRLMVDKALIAAGTGLVSNLLPGAAIAMAGLDLAATTALSAELIYQIAAAYGYDLESPDRKGEALTIFGLALSGSLAIEAGLGWLGNIPVAGAVVGASSNAAMIYALGYGACHFYEAKLANPLMMEATLETAQAENQKYLESAIDQQVVMDRILVHIVLAGNPDKSWEQILSELQKLNLSPASMDAIAANINSPPALETLLEQINSDFAVPLLAQCEKLAQLDGVITPEEAKVIETITKKFGDEINSMVK